MPAAANPFDPTTPPGPWPPSSDRRGGLARLLGLVRKLIDYGKELATTLQARGLTDRPAGASACFGTRDIALILSRIAVALLRADALEARLLRSAARPDPKPCPPRAPSQRAPNAARRKAEPDDEPDPFLARLPTTAQIAAEIRRRPIGAVLIDICRDLGIMADHPLWRELHPAIIFFSTAVASRPSSRTSANGHLRPGASRRARLTPHPHHPRRCPSNRPPPARPERVAPEHDQRGQPRGGPRHFAWAIASHSPTLGNYGDDPERPTSKFGPGPGSFAGC